MVHGVYARGALRVIWGLRISNPGWKNLISNVSFHVWCGIEGRYAYACACWLSLWILKFQFNVHMHVHVDSQNLNRTSICICTSIASWLLKKIFPTPVVLSYMCVRYMHGVYAHGAWVGLRISNPGWKNSISDVLCTVDLCFENFWSGLGFLNIACIVTRWNCLETPVW